MSPFGFSDPTLLWLLPVAAAVTLAGWWVASRTLPRGRRIASLAIRLLLVTCLVGALAGARITIAADRLAVVFLVDGSASMVESSRDDLVAIARDAVQEMPEGDLAGVVVFGANALVDRLPSDDRDLQDPASVPVAAATDVGAAIRLASAILPAGMQHRLVLLSDGNDTGGRAQEAVLAAAARGVSLDVVVPEGSTHAEALIDAIDAPTGARVGETVELDVAVRATVATTATLRLLADGATVATRELELAPGTVSVPFIVETDVAGFHVFRAVLEPATDHFDQNNAADAYVLVTGEPRILVATDDTARAADLVEALDTARQEVVLVGSGGVPSSLAALAGYDAVVLDNVAAASLGSATMDALQVYVRDLGRGLVMLGGRESYGAGGYLNSTLEETLPVYMTVRDRERSPEVAMVAVVDQSGSMADCHCTGDSRDTATSGTRGFEKVDIAKEAILRAAEALSPSDQLGVVTFNENAHWAVRTGPIDLGALGDGLGFEADGQTNIYAGLKAAYDDLVDNPATLRHIILITDGWSQSGAYDALLEDLKAAGITLSTIGTGGGSAHILRQLAQEAGGRYYDAADATRIPDIFLRETIRTAGEQIVEERFQPIPSQPSEILRGLDPGRLPQLDGYNATTAKGTATVALLTAREDPLLAQWQYGLGRAVAWTSDARQQWAGEWIGTEAFGTLLSQVVGWTLPPQDSQGIDVRFTPADDGELGVAVTSIDEDGAPRNFYRTVLRLVSPDLEPIQAQLEQVGPGQYAGTIRADRQGAYLVRVAQTADGQEAASRTVGLVNPAAAEYRRLGVDADALGGLAETTGGRELSGGDPEAFWSHDLRAEASPTPLWPFLLILAILLVPLDIGVRRVALTRGDLARARAWIGRRTGLAAQEPEATPGLAELRAARERTDRRSRRPAVPKATTADPVIPAGPAAGGVDTARPSAEAPRSQAAPRRAATPPSAEPPATAPPRSEPVDGPPGATLAERLAARRRERR